MGAALILAGAGRYLTDPSTGSLYEGLWRLLGVRVETPAPVDRGQGGSDPPARSDGETSGGPVLSPEAMLVWTHRYEACGCEHPSAQPAASRLTGLDETSLARELRGAEIIAFSADQVEILTILTGWCPEHTGRSVRLDGDVLRAYAGSFERPEGLIPLWERTVRGLLDSAFRKALEAGMSFPDEATATKQLEGIGD